MDLDVLKTEEGIRKIHFQSKVQNGAWIRKKNSKMELNRESCLKMKFEMKWVGPTWFLRSTSSSNDDGIAVYLFRERNAACRKERFSELFLFDGSKMEGRFLEFIVIWYSSH